MEDKLPFDAGAVIYLDNAATTFPKPKDVLDKAFAAYTRFGVNPGRSGYDLCLLAGDLVVETRRTLTRFFGGSDPNRLVFAANATDALNLLIQGVLAEGDHAISTTIEHNSVIRPLNHMARDRGVEVDYVPVDACGRVDPRAVAARIRPNTRLVVVNHGSNVIGTIQPVGEIGRLCRARGVTFAVDTAQTAGVVPIDMRAMCIDVVAFTGHKSLLAPTGIGGLCIGDGVEIRPTRFGGTGVNSIHPYHLDEYPYRLEAGTGNLLGIAGLRFGQEYLAARGLDAIYRHEMELFERLQRGLQSIAGLTLHGTVRLEDRLPVLSFTLAGRDPAEIGTILDVEHNVAARTGLQCAPLIHRQMGTDAHGTVRFSVGPLNTEDDIEGAIAAVAAIASRHQA